MNVDIRVTENFKRAAKKLLKKYSSLKVELADLEKDLLSNPEMGTPIGNDCYKIRLAVKSKGRGKSGGVRIITHLIVKLERDAPGLTRVYLVYIYDKSEMESIADIALRKLIKEIKEIIEESASSL
jgi:mRNA-degrading endonuclease RelE of RelBE toxin-antitoxin system